MNIAVFASGRGSNFQAILNALHRGFLPATVTLFVSNNAGAGAFEIARSHNIPAVHISRKQFSSEEAFASSLLNELREHSVDFIALAGYLKRIPSVVVGSYRNRILNIHPALLPSFGGDGMYGHHVHEAVLKAGEKRTCVTIHYVTPELPGYDEGPIIAQMWIDIPEGITTQELQKLLLPIEHITYVAVLKSILTILRAQESN